MFAAVGSGSTVTSCRVGESSCQAKCICHSGSSCSLTSAELLGKQQARVQLAVSLQSVMSSEDVTSDNVVGWVSSLSALTQQPDEISPSLATDGCQHIVRSAVFGRVL